MTVFVWGWGGGEKKLQWFDEGNKIPEMKQVVGAK